jgi:hypothetical protein
MFHQINPTEMFRERELALLRETGDRRLARRLRAKRTPKASSTIAAVLGFLAALVVAGFMLVVSSSPAHADTTFTVNSNADFADNNTLDGVCDTDFASADLCTLRAAIEQANATPGPDTIGFNILGSDVKTISPNSPLPEITDRVTIDGYSQPGSSPNTLAQGTNAVLEVELDGSNAGSGANGLVIRPDGSGSVIRGLVINRFLGDGVTILGGTQNRIEGNFIGTDPSGTIDRGNGRDGVDIFASTSNTVGGSSPAARNLISGNGQGVELNGAGATTSLNSVEGNFIGTRKDGTSALGNTFNGVDIPFSTNNTFSSNAIAFNGDDGVEISRVATGNLLFGNSIYSNGEQGIDLNGDGVTPNDPLDADVGPNTLQNFPLIASARTSRKATTIKGTLNSTPNKVFTVQLFSNASGDEGQRFIGQTSLTTDSSGIGSFTFKPALKVRKGKITATASDLASRNTSEFSAAKKVVRRR